jgi:acyl carrier protein phosphodiesterase
MNFLAHLYLSHDEPQTMVGNFIGDFVKGRSLADQYTPGIVRGIELHRAIDLFTDTHAVVKESKARLRPLYRHYAGVIVDIFYDHFLARNWNTFHPEFLPDYADRFYDLIRQHETVVPPEVNYMMPYMIKGNWLVNYARLEGIERALQGMARRARHESRMDESIRELREHYDAFEREFMVFFPELTAHSQAWLAEHPAT